MAEGEWTGADTAEAELDAPIQRGCGVCGGSLVRIRPRYPQQKPREVCPTCMADRLEMIREMASPHYGQAAQEVRSGDEAGARPQER